MMSKIMVNITLPCTIVQAFDGFERDAGMFVIVGIGLLCAFVPILLMCLTTGGVEKRLRAYRMLNIGGYNIGCFSLPLVQAFFAAADARREEKAANRAENQRLAAEAAAAEAAAREAARQEEAAKAETAAAVPVTPPAPADTPTEVLPPETPAQTPEEPAPQA